MISFGVYLERLRRQLIRLGHPMPVIEDLSEDGLFRYAKMLEEVFMLVEPDDFFLEMRKRFFEEFVGGSKSLERGTLNEESDGFSGFDDGFGGGSEGGYESRGSVRGDLGGLNFLGLSEIDTNASTEDEVTLNGWSSDAEDAEYTSESKEDITKRWMGYLKSPDTEGADGFSSAFDGVGEVEEPSGWGTSEEEEPSNWSSDDLDASGAWSDDADDAQADWGTSNDDEDEPSAWGTSDEDESSSWVSEDLDDQGAWSDDDSEDDEPASWGTEDEDTDEEPSGWGSDDEEEPTSWGTSDDDADEGPSDWGTSQEEANEDEVFNVSGLLDGTETSDITKEDTKDTQETEKEEIVTEKTSVQRSNDTIKMLSGLFGRKK